MKGKRVCSFLAGLQNLLYALTLTVGILLAAYAGISAALNLNSEGGDLSAALAAFGGAIVLVVAVIAILVMLAPCVCTWISSIGLIKRAVKGKRPLGFCILSVIIHSLLILGGGIALIIAVSSGTEAVLYFLIAAEVVASVINIVLCSIAMTGWNKSFTPEQLQDNIDT